MDISGIYKITNTKNDRIYIGSSKNIASRWHAHKRALRLNQHSNKFLQSDYNKCGAEAFVYSVIEFTEELHVDSRLQLEEEYISQYFDGGKQCYNLCKRAIVGGGYSKNPEETKAKLSAISLAHWADDVWRQKQIQLVSEALAAPEVKEKRLKALANSWHNNEKRAQNQSKKMKEFHANNEEVSARVTKALTENQPKGRVTFREKMKTDPEFRAIYVKTGLEKTAKNNKRYAEDPEYKAMMDAKSRENFQRYNEQKMAAMPCKPPIVAPDGTVYSDVKSINQFAKDHSFDSSSLYKLFSGQMKTYRGWKLLTPIAKPEIASTDSVG